MMHDLSGAFAWTSKAEAQRIREESDIRRSYGELRAEWVREEKRKKKAKRDPFVIVFALMAIAGALACVWLKANWWWL